MSEERSTSRSPSSGGTSGLGNDKYAARLDADKPDYTYLTKELRDGIAGVMAYGTKKYSKGQWLRSLDTEKHEEYMESILRCMLRHAHAIADGEDLDAESGYHHAAHVATNAMMYLTYLGGKKNVSRSKQGSVPVSECDGEQGDVGGDDPTGVDPLTGIPRVFRGPSCIDV